LASFAIDRLNGSYVLVNSATVLTQQLGEKVFLQVRQRIDPWLKTHSIRKAFFERLKEGAEKGLLPSNAIQKHPSAAKAGADFKALAARLNSLVKKSFPQVGQKVRG
jgi:hypothetical protein